ncbi:hypothetical protein KXS07_10585 [Inquilinus limosus]|uniref:hypothetical protein n=1 Tax=Inquilinus limosus TaxID=171674 RepID=UPI003F16063E
MAESIDHESQPDWRDPSAYKVMTALGRRAWAWQWARRNDRLRTSLMPSSPAARFLRHDPPITVIAWPGDDTLARWGMHFRVTARLRFGGGVRRLAG